MLLQSATPLTTSSVVGVVNADPVIEGSRWVEVESGRDIIILIKIFYNSTF